MKTTTTYLSIFLIFGMFVSSHAQQVFKVNIDRKMATNACTMGYMSVNDKAMFYTLELPWKDNQNKISCIPAGTFNGILRYDHSDKWRIELQNVPNRGNVQIHIGNYTKNTLGCILVGDNANTNACSVTGSVSAYKKFKKEFYGSENPNQTPNKTIKVIVAN